MGLPGASLGKSEKRMRTQSYTSNLPEFPVVAAPTTTPVAPAPEKRRTSSKISGGGSLGRKPRRKGQLSQLSTKDLGRWKPTDDLALILGVQQVLIIIELIIYIYKTNIIISKENVIDYFIKLYSMFPYAFSD